MDRSIAGHKSRKVRREWAMGRFEDKNKEFKLKLGQISVGI